MSRKFLNKILLLLTVAAVFGTKVYAGSTDYLGHWAESQIREFYEKGYVLGYPDGSFKPDREITRAEFFTLINRVFDLKSKGEVTFKDVSKSSWYKDEIYNAVNAGYISGYDDGTIKPDNIVSRIEASKILANLLKWDGSFKKEDFNYKDADEVPDWAKADLFNALQQGYLKSSSDGWILPYKGITRAEAVVLLYKAKVGEIDKDLIPEVNAETELTGVLIDKHCFAFGEPEKDSVECLKMKKCEASGYGVAVKQGDGNYIFYKFDDKGQEIAKEILKTTTKENNVVVRAKGLVSGDIIRITELAEK